MQDDKKLQIFKLLLDVSFGTEIIVWFQSINMSAESYFHSNLGMQANKQ